MPPFSTIWVNHPTVKNEAPLLDLKMYDNQCAINLSAALMRAGFDMKNYSGAWSWQKNKPRYAIRAQELANWLSNKLNVPNLKVEKFVAKEAFTKIEGRTGIIFIQNYWGPQRQGDHIDLWNGARLTDRFSWARIHLNISWEGRISNYRNAESIWFWEIA